MSGEGDVGGARRAAAELSGSSVARLLAGFAAAETVPQKLEPDLLLLGLNIFGTITAPIRGAPAGEGRTGGRTAPAAEPAARGRGSRSPLAEALDAANAALRQRESPWAALASAAKAAGPVLPVGRGKRPGGAPAAGGESEGRLALQLRELFGGTAAAETPGPGGEPTALATVLGRIASAGAAAAAAPTPLEALQQAALRAVGTPAPVPETSAAATLGELSRLTASILAHAVEAGAQGRAGSSGSAAARQPQPAVRGLADILQETFGPHAQAQVGGGARRPSEAAEGETTGAAPAQAQDSPPASTVTDADGREPDPATLAALVNDALVEQARRHGLELG